MKDFLGLVALIVVPLAAILGLAMAGEAYQCSRYEAVTGKPTRYSGAQCFINDKGEWFAWDEYKNRLVASGAKK